jgi:dipeptidyl aminopeptidase/acylaminoacyl peptidase
MALRSGSRPLLAAGAVVLALGLIHAQAPAGRPMAIDDLIGSVRIGDPQLSPDDRTVVFVRTTTDLESGARNADIWSVPADGSAEPKALIAGPRGESTPRFSPDGRRIAFISTRDGAPQVYVADAAGGNVKKVTDLARGVKAPLVFSPDGRRLAFVSDVYRDCADEACNRQRLEEAEKNPVKVRRLTRLLYRHWDTWRDDTRQHVFVVSVDGGEARDLTPGDFDSPPFFQEDASIAFSPDGEHVAFVSNREGNDREAWTTNTDVWLVPVAGGEARKITSNPAADAEPVFSKDGRTLYVRAQRRAGFESDRWYLDAYSLAAGTKRTLFTSPDISLGHYWLSPDGATIWFTAQQEGREDLFAVPATGGTPRRVMKGGMISNVQVGADALVFSRASLTAPPDIYRAALDGTGMTPLTEANASWLKEVAFAEPESRTVGGHGQHPIQYWLIRPPNFDPSRRYPVVFLIHGGPQSAWMDAWSTRWNPSLWAAQGWVVVAPNPRGSTGFGQKFVDEITGDWAGKVMTDLDAVFHAVSAMPFVDARRMAVAGASYGGYAVNWIISQQPDRFRAAVSHDGVFNLDSMSLATEELWFTEWEFLGRPWDPKAREQFAKFSPHLHAHRIRTPTLIITNELDFRVPVDQGLQMLTALRRNGVPAEALVFPDEGHWVLKALNSRYWHEAVFDWIRKHI